MYKLLVRLKAANFVEFFLYEIFDCFDIVVRCLFNFLHPCGILFGKIIIYRPQLRHYSLVKPFKLGQRNFRQPNEIFNFNPCAVFHQGIL